MKGSGSVRLRGKTWSYRVGLGKMKIDGKRKQIEGSGFRTQKEAVKAMHEILAQYHKTGEYVDNKKITFQQNSEEFIQVESSATRAYATILRYESIYRNHLQNEFGPLYLYQIDSKRIQTFLHEKSSKYSESFVKSLYKAFNVLFSYAYRNKVIKVNPMDDVAPPPDPRHRSDVVIYSAQEREKIQERIESTNVKSAYYIGLNTGVRVSECFALRWSDIDWRQRALHIQRNVVKLSRQPILVKEPKTRAGVRVVYLSKELCKLLRAWEKECQWEKEQQGAGALTQDDYLFRQPNGDPMVPCTFAFRFKKILRKNGLPENLNVHSLRHTNASMLIAQGVDVRTVAGLLGHSQPSTTLDIYSHAFDKNKRLAGQKLSEAMGL